MIIVTVYCYLKTDMPGGQVCLCINQITVLLTLLPYYQHNYRITNTISLLPTQLSYYQHNYLISNTITLLPTQLPYYLHNYLITNTITLLPAQLPYSQHNFLITNIINILPTQLPTCLVSAVANCELTSIPLTTFAPTLQVRYLLSDRLTIQLPDVETKRCQRYQNSCIR